MNLKGIILAAGLSSRMEAFKPLLTLKNKTMIEHSVESMLVAGVQEVIVVLGHRAAAVEAVLRKHDQAFRLVLVQNRNYAKTDMFASVKIGLASLTACDAFYLLPGDMPAVHSRTYLALQKALAGKKALVAFPVMDGRRKHPPLVAWECAQSILRSESTGGLREVWQQFEPRIIHVPVMDRGCLLDADTKGDYRTLLEYVGSSVFA